MMTLNVFCMKSLANPSPLSVRLSACIPYHLKSSRLKTGRVALGFTVEVGGRSGSGALSRGTSHQSDP